MRAFLFSNRVPTPDLYPTHLLFTSSLSKPQSSRLYSSDRTRGKPKPYYVKIEEERKRARAFGREQKSSQNQDSTKFPRFNDFPPESVSKKPQSALSSVPPTSVEFPTDKTMSSLYSKYRKATEERVLSREQKRKKLNEPNTGSEPNKYLKNRKQSNGNENLAASNIDEALEVSELDEATDNSLSYIFTKRNMIINESKKEGEETIDDIAESEIDLFLSQVKSIRPSLSTSSILAKSLSDMPIVQTLLRDTPTIKSPPSESATPHITQIDQSPEPASSESPSTSSSEISTTLSTSSEDVTPTYENPVSPLNPHDTRDAQTRLLKAIESSYLTKQPSNDVEHRASNKHAPLPRGSTFKHTSVVSSHSSPLSSGPTYSTLQLISSKLDTFDKDGVKEENLAQLNRFLSICCEWGAIELVDRIVVLMDRDKCEIGKDAIFTLLRAFLEHSRTDRFAALWTNLDTETVMIEKHRLYHLVRIAARKHNMASLRQLVSSFLEMYFVNGEEASSIIHFFFQIYVDREQRRLEHEREAQLRAELREKKRQYREQMEKKEFEDYEQSLSRYGDKFGTNNVDTPELDVPVDEDFANTGVENPNDVEHQPFVTITVNDLEPQDVKILMRMLEDLVARQVYLPPILNENELQVILDIMPNALISRRETPI